jgi:hypothetical protein
MESPNLRALPRKLYKNLCSIPCTARTKVFWDRNDQPRALQNIPILRLGTMVKNLPQRNFLNSKIGLYQWFQSKDCKDYDDYDRF